MYYKNIGIIVLYVDKKKEKNCIYILVYFFNYHDRCNGGIFIVSSIVRIMIKD